VSQKKLFLTILASVVGIPLLIASLFFFQTFVDVDKQLSGPVTVTTQWQEITPTISMRPWKQSQYVSLNIDGACTKPLCLTDAFQQGKLMLADNTYVTPQVEIVDANGKVYNLHVSMIDDKGIGYGKGCDPDCGFPWTKYRTVRIRSDRPFHASGIAWHCHTGK
jgi:hypothetical protein